MQPNAFGTIGGSLRLLAAGLLLCGLAARAETFYANGGGTKTTYAYDWFNKDNWKVKDGDAAIFDKTVSGMMSLYPDSAVAPGLQRVQFNANNTIHQGYVSILAGGDGKALLLEYYAGTTFILR